MGDKEQPSIDQLLLPIKITVKHHTFSLAGLGYHKAFDLMPHSWLLKVFEVYKVHPVIYKLLSTTRSTWNTTSYLPEIVAQALKINRGIL